MEPAEIEISDEKLDRFLELVIDLLFEAWKREVTGPAVQQSAEEEG